MAEVGDGTLNNELGVESFVEFPSYSSEKGNCWINVKLSAPECTDQTQLRPSIDLVAVIDRSSSMKGDKFRLVKQSLYFLVSKLNSRDRLSLVVFDQKAEIIFSLTPVSSHVRDWLDVKIENLGTGKWTNLCEGLVEGIKILEERRSIAAVASLLLFSDGFATSGITNRQKVVNAMNNPYNERRLFSFLTQNKTRSYTVNTFGIGAHDAPMLDAISEAGNGQFYYTSCPKEIERNLANCMGGLLSTFAQDISVNIESLNGAMFLEGEDFELSSGHTFANMGILDIQCEEERDLLFNLNLPPLKDKGETSYSYAKVKIGYTNSQMERREFITRDIVIKRNRNLKSTYYSNNEVDIQKNRWKAIHAMRNARAKAREGDIKNARHILTECKARISNSDTANCSLSKMIKWDIDRIVVELKDRDSFIRSGEALLSTSLNSHTRQRSTTYDTGEYMTSIRCETLNESARFTRTKGFINN